MKLGRSFATKALLAAVLAVSTLGCSQSNGASTASNSQPDGGLASASGGVSPSSGGRPGTNSLAETSGRLSSSVTGGTNTASAGTSTVGSPAGGTSAVGSSSQGGVNAIQSVAGGSSAFGGRSSFTGQGGSAVGTGGVTSDGTRNSTGGSFVTGGTLATGGTFSTGNRTASVATGGSSGTGGKTGAGGTTSMAGTAACNSSQPVPKAGDQTVTLQSGGKSRSYVLHAPSGLTTGNPLALVIDLHGAGGNGRQQQGMSGFSSLADTEKFLAVFPDGIDGYWNVDDKCCGTAGQQKIDDVGFLKAIISKLRAETCIDTKRIYITGFSNGGGLAHRMGCDAADVIAAIAPTATDLRTQPCNSARPISMMEVKGMADSLEPYEGGLVGPAGGQYTAVGAKQSLKLWAGIDQCTGTTTTINTYCESYTQCADNVEADLCSLPNTDHDIYGNSLGFRVASVVWSMFKRQPMK